ncbi:MAG TPA: SpoIIE family protein phosphatase [Kofleriaceae bacterium]|nr:SpoIIE family protein phosphatase [Kofleriaceae bacterium]
MTELRWSWQATPYLVCTLLLVAVTLGAALIRGDRVLRIGVIAAAMTAIPWALCQALAACTDDAIVAARFLRLGQGPVASVGPNLMLVILGVSGQLERYRWVARLAGLVATVALVICWATDWVVPGAQRVPLGMYYMKPGPLTGLHISQLLIWLGVGLFIARRAAPGGSERKRLLRLLLGVLVAGAIGSIDTLLLYQIAGIYPIAWLPASVACGIALYLIFKTDLLRPQGFDRGMAIEIAMFGATTIAIAALALALGTSHKIPLAAFSALAWAIATGIAWSLIRARPVRVKGERELEQFIGRVTTYDDQKKIAERLGALWKRAVGIDVKAMWWVEGAALTNSSGEKWTIDREVSDWLVQHDDPLALTDLATMRLGDLRAKVEALGAAHGATMLVPLVDRGELVGLIEADYSKALRDAERGLIDESARAAARSLTFVGLARAAARERETAREVEVADALRLQASASRDAELGRWAVAAEYRTAARTTGAGWSAIELPDGRLALLVTEAQAQGVAAALATAALTGAFAAATSGSGTVTRDGLISTMRASSEGVLRSGQPVSAFLAILDAQAQTIEWACAGHPGGFLVGPIAAVDAGLPAGSTKGARPKATPITAGKRVKDASLTAAIRGNSAFHPDTLLVVASTGLRGPDDESWQTRLQEFAPASGRLASVLVDTALKAGEPAEDMLAVVVRAR